MSTDRDSRILDILLAEASAALQHGQDSKRRNEQFLAIGGAAAIALVTLGVDKKSPIPFLILPNLLCFIASYTQRITSEIILFGLYRKHLEEEINRRIDADLLLWEHGVVSLEHTRLRIGSSALLMNGALFGMFILAAGVTGGYKAHLAYGQAPWIQYAYACVTIIAILGVVASFYEAQSVFVRAPVAIRHAIEKSTNLRVESSLKSKLKSARKSDGRS